MCALEGDLCRDRARGMGPWRQSARSRGSGGLEATQGNDHYNLWADAVLPGETSWEKVTFSGKLDFKGFQASGASYRSRARKMLLRSGPNDLFVNS